MDFKNKWVLLFLGTFLLFVIEVLYFYPKLPDTVASHFNIEGNVDNYMNKNNFVLMIFGIYLAITIFFLIFAIKLPSMSTKHLNLPHKELLLDESHRKESLKKISIYFIKLSSLTNAFFICLFLLTSYVSIKGLNKLPSVFFILLALYIISMIVLFMGFNRDMRKLSEMDS
ncbi:MAG TPA: DUF1648 domain-containing protein [Ignavibacteriaceae bacterium]|nr:DUF1648 domain-containing protein [Ignavibacteriaceae bacterium]